MYLRYKLSLSLSVCMWTGTHGCLGALMCMSIVWRLEDNLRPPFSGSLPPCFKNIGTLTGIEHSKLARLAG